MATLDIYVSALSGCFVCLCPYILEHHWYRFSVFQGRTGQTPSFSLHPLLKFTRDQNQCPIIQRQTTEQQTHFILTLPGICGIHLICKKFGQRQTCPDNIVQNLFSHHQLPNICFVTLISIEQRDPALCSGPNFPVK